jgi:hypothetical protein
LVSVLGSSLRLPLTFFFLLAENAPRKGGDGVPVHFGLQHRLHEIFPGGPVHRFPHQRQSFFIPRFTHKERVLGVVTLCTVPAAIFLLLADLMQKRREAYVSGKGQGRCSSPCFLPIHVEMFGIRALVQAPCSPPFHLRCHSLRRDSSTSPCAHPLFGAGSSVVSPGGPLAMFRLSPVLPLPTPSGMHRLL